MKPSVLFQRGNGKHPSRTKGTLATPLGGVFRDARRSLGLSQRELASRGAGSTQSALSRFERGLASAVDLDAVERLASGLGGRVRFLFDAPFLADRVAQRDRIHARCLAICRGPAAA